jgi:hypothetical protein
MTALYYAPCAVYGSTRFYLPPGLAASWTESQGLTVLKPYRGDRAIVAAIEATEGITVSMSGEWMFDDPTTASVLAAWQDLRQLKGRSFDLFLFSDEGFPGCALQSLDLEIPRTRMEMLRFSLAVFCPASGPTTALQLPFTDYQTEYPYAAQVGRPRGNARSGGSVMAGQPVLQSLQVMFPGVQDETTAAGQEFRLVVGGEVGRNWVVTGLQITGAEPLGSTGETRVRASGGGVGSGSGFVEASVASGAHFGSRATGTLVVASGSTLHCWCSTSGGHQNLQVTATLKLEAS